ncbi:MAG TPA: BamA/TamA family outer membrane protein [Polyangiaceae bacterium]|nr:BamA/TamA family outer membrane protein [Polyangiaceae bacterium]
MLRAVRRHALHALLALVTSSLAAAQPAQAPPASPEQRPMSTYEQRTIDEILAQRGGEIDPAPEGKLIERIDIVRLDVFDEHDPIPDFLNVFHTTTRERVVTRELLFAAGQHYSAERADETARNLREQRQVSLVLIVPLRGSTDDRVRVLVVTRDTWSLRLNWSLALGDRGLSYLLLNPSEENLFGTHSTLGAIFLLYPETYSVGAVASQRRIAGSHLEGSVGGTVILNRDSGKTEGSSGTFYYAQPLYAIDVEWAWATGIIYRDEIYRLYAGDAVQTFDADVTGIDDEIPVQYRSERTVGQYELLRSFGRQDKFDLSVGVEADRRHYHWNPPPGTLPAAQLEFRREMLPVSDTRASPFVQLRSYGTRFMTTLDLETLGLQEDYRLGPSALLRLYPASTAVGSTRDMIGVLAGLQYTLAWGDGLIRPLVSNTVEYEFHDRNDALLEARLRIATPSIAVGRLVLDGLLLTRYENYLRRRFYIGGEGRLRGYAPNAYGGPNVAAFNAEFRTRSVDILSAQVGLAAFYDTGHAADTFEELDLKHSVGLGLRILLPQFDRSAFRFDWGLPLSLARGPLPGGFFFTVTQAFSMPSLAAPTVTSMASD